MKYVLTHILSDTCVSREKFPFFAEFIYLLSTDIFSSYLDTTRKDAIK